MNATHAPITIVSGLPRSGTSMTMRMLEAGGMPVLTDGIRSADEDNPNGYYELEAVKQTKSDSSWANDAVGKVVKMVHLLLYDLPADHTYRVVFIRRNPQEIVASQTAMLERVGKPGSGLNPELLINQYNRQIDVILNWLIEQPNFEVLEVSYNEIIRNNAPVIDTICTFLGQSLDRDAMRAVVDPTLYRQRR